MYNEGLIITKDNPELVNYFSLHNNSKKSRNSALLNNLTYINWYNRLKLMYISMYEWENLPDGIDSEWIETQLFEHGRLGWFKTDNHTTPYNSNLVLPFNNSDNSLNIYGKPYKVICRGKTDSTFDVYYSDLVEIRANISGYAPMETAALYAYRISKVERSLDVNINNQKFPFIFKGTENQKLSVINFMQNFNDNEQYFIVEENSPVTSSNFDVFNTNAPYVGDKLMQYKHDIINEWLTFCGLNNANTDKKERLIVDEVNANDEEVKISGSSGLISRQKAADKINKKFNLQIKVDQVDLSNADFGLSNLINSPEMEDFKNE